MLRLLGPLELTTDGRSLDLGGPRQRVVLSMLALNANRVASMDQLIDAVWEDSPPSTARGQIQICISRLRKMFHGAGAPDAIRTQAPGYLLRLPQEHIDQALFEGLVAKGRAHLDADRPAEAAPALRSALALWRGPALADISNTLPRRSARVLDDARTATQVEYLRTRMATGHHREVISEVRALLNDNPLHEGLHGLLMLALYRAGRQADALAAFRAARDQLVEDVGVEPCDELRSLEREILNHDPKLGGAGPREPARIRDVPALDTAADLASDPASEAAPVPRQLPASAGDFTGRSAELAEIGRVLAEGTWSAYATPIVVISGRGGVGKSALAVRAAHEAGPSFPDGHLYADLGGRDGAAGILASFLRALGVGGPAIPEETRDRIALYRSRVAGKRLLVLLDDIGSEEQALQLLPGGPGCAVIITSRSGLGSLAGAHWLELDHFSAENSLALLGRIIGTARVAAERDAAADLVELCGGLPLALRIAGARLASRPHWRVRDLVDRLSDEEHWLDEFAYHGLELRSNIALSYDALDPRAQRLFRLSALVQGPDLPAWTAAAVLDTGLAEAREVLETLADARLVDIESGDGRMPRFRFHSLLRAYAAEQTATDPEADRQAALSRVTGGWLTLAGEAHRMQYGGDYKILHGTAPRWWLPGTPPDEVVGTPADWWETERTALVAAVGQAAENGRDEACWDLALNAISLFEEKGYFDDWLATTRQAEEATRRAGNRQGQAAMLLSLGELHLFQKRLGEAEPCFQEAWRIFTDTGNEHGAALVLSDWAMADRLRGDLAAMFPKILESLRTFDKVGDRIGAAYTMCNLARYWIGESEYGKAEEMLNSALVICQTERCRRVEAQALHCLADLYLATGKTGLATQALERVRQLVHGVGDRIGEAYARYSLGVVHHHEGDLARAEDALHRALTLSIQVGEPQVEGQARFALAEIALARGDLPAAEHHLTVAVRVFGDLQCALWQGKSHTLRSEAHRARGDTAAAGTEIEQALRLLARTTSKEAGRWLDLATGMRTTLQPNP